MAALQNSCSWKCLIIHRKNPALTEIYPRALYCQLSPINFVKFPKQFFTEHLPVTGSDTYEELEKRVRIRSFFGLCLPHSDWIRRDTEYLYVFSPNAGKCRPEKLRIRTLFTHWLQQIRLFFRRSFISWSKNHSTKTVSTISKNLLVAWQVNELASIEKTATVYSYYKDLREFTRISKNFYKKVN